MSKFFMWATSVVVVFLAVTSDVQAQQFTITSAKASKNGPAYCESVTGNYTLAPNDVLVGVYIIAYDAKGNVSSTAQGVFKNGTWTAALGDFQMASWQIYYKVQY